MTAPLAHTRVPKAARDLCRSRAEQACVFFLWDEADEARWQPFNMSTRHFRGGIISSGAANRLFGELISAGLVQVVEKGRGTKASLVVVCNPTTGEFLRSEDTPRERKASANDAQGERKASAEDADGDCANEEDENTARAQGERKASANGALNAGAENSLQPPASKDGDTSSVEDPPTFVQQDAGLGQEPSGQDSGPHPEPDHPPAAEPEPEPPPKPAARVKAQALWGALQAIREHYQPTARGQAATRKRLDNLVAGCHDLHQADMDREDLLRAAHWVHTSDRPQARGARDTGDPLKVLLRRTHVIDYCEIARDDEDGAATQAGPDPRSRGRPSASDAAERERVLLAEMYAEAEAQTAITIHEVPPCRPARAS